MDASGKGLPRTAALEIFSTELFKRTAIIINSQKIGKNIFRKIRREIFLHAVSGICGPRGVSLTPLPGGRCLQLCWSQAHVLAELRSLPLCRLLRTYLLPKCISNHHVS